MTVLFADLAGFTTLSERLDPEAVHDLMDGCSTILGEQIHRYEGTINRPRSARWPGVQSAPGVHARAMPWEDAPQHAVALRP